MADLEFVENVAVWSFAGLLAISASPLAAIAFLTVAPKFVIALRTGNLGGIVTLYVDGIPAAVIDTHSDVAGVVQRILVGDPDLDEHQIYVQKDDDPDTIIEVIRKELSPDEVSPASLRWNEDCDCIQRSPDGGTTWTDDPGNDPRISPGFRFPPVVADDPRCKAAANMVRGLRDVINADLAFDTVTGLVNDLLGVLVIIEPEIGLIIGAIFLAAQIILDIGAGAIEAAFTEDIYDAFLCVFYDNIDDDGQMSDAQLADIYTAVAAQFDLVVQAVFGAHSSTIGPVGWSNAGALGTETGDCTTCDEWCYYFDVTNFDAWTLLYGTLGMGGVEGEYGNVPINVPPFTGSAYGVLADISIVISSPTTITKVTVVWDPEYTHDDGGTGIRCQWATLYDGHNDGESNGEQTEFFNIDVGEASGTLEVSCDFGYSGSPYPPPDPTCKILSVKIEGTGENPFGEDNCT